MPMTPMEKPKATTHAAIPPISCGTVCLFRTREDHMIKEATMIIGITVFFPIKYSNNTNCPVTLHACPLALKCSKLQTASIPTDRR